MRRGSIPTIICGTDRSFLILFLQMKSNPLDKLIKWMTDGLVGGVVTTWQSPTGLSVFVFPLACQKKKKRSLTQLWPKGGEFCRKSVLYMWPLVLAFWYGWPNKLTPTDSVKIPAVPIYVPMSSKRPRKFKSYWSSSPAAVDEFYGYFISRRDHCCICCLVDCFMSIFISLPGCGDCI